MFGACLRVSETIGLTWSDVDMKNREIHVGGQLVYYEGDEGYCFHDSETKTDAGMSMNVGSLLKVNTAKNVSGNCEGHRTVSVHFWMKNWYRQKENE